VIYPVKMLRDSIKYRQRHTLRKSTRIAITRIDARYWGIEPHRYPWWLGLKAHIVIEKMLQRLPRKSRLSAPVHIMHGWICDYSMRDIIKYLRNQTDYSV